MLIDIDHNQPGALEQLDTILSHLRRECREGKRAWTATFANGDGGPTVLTLQIDLHTPEQAETAKAG